MVRKHGRACRRRRVFQVRVGLVHASLRRQRAHLCPGRDAAGLLSARRHA